MKARTYILEKLTALMAGHGLGLPPKTTVEPPKNEQHGDIATNVAMVMPREKGENPRALAESIKAELAPVCPELERIDIAGPGFINFTFTDTFWQSVALDALTQGRDFGRVNVGQGRRVQVEYVSANPTGPLHIGHGRGAAIGDSLTRVLRFTGHEVETEYYLNDAGRQMRLLGLAVWVRYQQACGRQVEFPEDCYRGDYIKDISARLRAEHGEALLDLPEAEAIDLCYERGMRDILDGIRADLAAFRVEHQHFFITYPYICSAVSFSQNHRNLRHCSLTISVQHFGSMSYYTARLLIRSRQESRHVLNGKKRNIESITTPYKPCGFIRSVYIKTSCSELRLICYYTYSLPVHSYKTRHYVFRIMRHNVIYLLIVSQLFDYIIYIISLVRIVGNYCFKFRNKSVGIIPRIINGCRFQIIGRKISEQLSDLQQCFRIIFTYKMCYTARTVMRHCSA